MQSQAETDRYRRRGAALALLGSLCAYSGGLNARAAEPVCPIEPSAYADNGAKFALDATTPDDPLDILAIGSSSTEGVGATAPDRTYPARLGAALRARARVNANVRNAGIGGEIAETTLARLKTALDAGWPELVIWQVGTNDALTEVDETRFRARIAEGVAAARAHKVPIILLDPQYTPGHADDSRYARYAAIVDDIGVTLHVPVIARYAMMKSVAQRGGAIDSWISADGLHMSDVGYACLADALVKPIVSAIVPVAAAKL